jgi:hypothetical protein
MRLGISENYYHFDLVKKAPPGIFGSLAGNLDRVAIRALLRNLSQEAKCRTSDILAEIQPPEQGVNDKSAAL